MPRSKAPRKQRKNKTIVSSIFLTKQAINELSDLFNTVEGIALTKLRQGLCDYDDAAIIRDAINLSTTLVFYEANMLPYGGFQGLQKDDYDTLERCRDAFHKWYFRGVDEGALIYPPNGKAIINHAVKFKCHMDEARHLMEGLDLVFRIIRAEMQDHPQTVLKLLNANKKMLKFTAGDKIERVSFEQVEMKKRLGRAIRSHANV